MNRLLSRTKVTCVSPRAQRGLDSLPVVRVTSMRLRATVSMITMSPRSTPRIRRRFASHWPLASGAMRRSVSLSRRGAPPSRADHPRRRLILLRASAIRSRAPSNRRTIAGCSADCRPAPGPRMMLSTVSGNGLAPFCCASTPTPPSVQAHTIRSSFFIGVCRLHNNS